jgi:hypothetical protein
VLHPVLVVQPRLTPTPALQELFEVLDSDVPIAAFRLILPLPADRMMSPARCEKDYGLRHFRRVTKTPEKELA